MHYWQGRAHRAEALAQPDEVVRQGRRMSKQKLTEVFRKFSAQPEQETEGKQFQAKFNLEDRAVKTYHEGKPVYVSQPEQSSSQEPTIKQGWDVDTLLDKPEQEPVAYFDWLPEEATHIAQIKVKTRSGGRLEMGAYVFKYDNEVLMVYTTDNDNEYPGWREAKQCFYHLNFPVFPIPTTPPKRPWVGLTDAEMQALWDRYAHMEMMRAIEAKLKEKNT